MFKLESLEIPGNKLNIYETPSWNLCFRVGQEQQPLTITGATVKEKITNNQNIDDLNYCQWIKNTTNIVQKWDLLQDNVTFSFHRSIKIDELEIQLCHLLYDDQLNDAIAKDSDKVYLEFRIPKDSINRLETPILQSECGEEFGHIIEEKPINDKIRTFVAVTLTTDKLADLEGQLSLGN